MVQVFCTNRQVVFEVMLAKNGCWTISDRAEGAGEAEEAEEDD